MKFQLSLRKQRLTQVRRLIQVLKLFFLTSKIGLFAFSFRSRLIQVCARDMMEVGKVSSRVKLRLTGEKFW